MVLKRAKCSKWHCGNGCVLQSNHYGIETTQNFILFFKGEQVAIEPLWYWNYRFFLTYLHGTQVAIEPLWYWNSSERIRRGSSWRLQSNHYGIETKKARVSPLWPCCVAIEPLWYWNSFLLSLKTPHISRCNRTIMVLKRDELAADSMFIFIKLQSNHYGIETSTQSSRLGSSSTCCNRTIMVLKLPQKHEYW